MPLTVGGSLGTKHSRRGGKVRREQECAGKGGWGGPEHLIEGNQEGFRRRDLKGRRGGASVHVGESNVTGTPDGSRIEHIPKIGTESSVLLASVQDM